MPLPFVRRGYRASLIALSALTAHALPGQELTQPLQLADRGPAFFTLSPRGGGRVDVSSAVLFRRRVSVNLVGVSIPQALDAIAAQTGVEFGYRGDVLPAGARVTLQATSITVAAALTEVLMDAGVDVQLTGALHLNLIARGTVHGVSAHQQTGTVTGQVTDAKTGTPVADVTIAVGGTSVAARSGAEGRYTLHQVPAGEAAITFRHLGYLQAARTVTVADTVIHLNVALEPSPAVLDQVVTTVTGRQSLRSIGNAISTINADSLVPTTPVTNLGDVINARAPGVQVINVGLTGASPEIYIRGNGSLLLSTQPLLYVDGIRISNTSESAGPGAGTRGSAPGRFDDLAPDEIESIEIVKGPSAATLYGTDAANGVILVTTKRGIAGRAQWRVYAEGGALTVDPDQFPYNYTGWGHTSTGQITNACALFVRAAGGCTQDSVTKFTPLRVPGLTPIGTGNRAEAGLQVSGGGQGARYFIAGDYTSEVGYLKMPVADQEIIDTSLGPTAHSGQYTHPNAVSKYDGRINLTTPIGHTGEITLSTSYLSNNARVSGSGAPSDAVGGAGYRDSCDGWQSCVSPLQVFGNTNDEQTGHFIGAVTSRWSPLSWLTTRATTGVDYAEANYNTLTPNSAALEAIFDDSYVGNTKSTLAQYSIDLGATAKVPLTTWLSSSTSAGVQYNRLDDQNSTASATNLTIGGTSVSSGIPSGAAADSERVVAGAYVEEQLGFNDRLFLTGAVRVDGANDFGANLQSATYPKVGASWLLSQEPFFPHLGFLNSFRLRAAYGESGTQPGLVLTTLGVGSYQVDGATQAGASPLTVGNPNIQPERQTELEGGADIDVAASRVHLEFTYYNKRTTNALYDLPLGTELGSGSIEENIGLIWNWGYEALVVATPVETRGVTWTLGLNGSVNHNQVLNLGSQFQPFYGIFGTPSLVAGYPIYGFFTLPYTYKDLNHDGVIEPNEITVGTRQEFDGATLPPLQGTVSSHLTVLRGRVSLGMQFDYRGGFRMVNTYLGGQCALGTARALVDIHASLAQQAACLTYDVVAPYPIGGLTEDGDFVRFRELSLTYVPPNAVGHSLGLQSWSITLSARNLALWTRFSGGDPETIQGQAGFSAYSSLGLYGASGAPGAQYWLVRLNMGW